MKRILVTCAMAAVVVSAGAYLVISGQRKAHVPSDAEYQRIRTMAGSSGAVIGMAAVCNQDTKEIVSRERSFIDSFHLTPSQETEIISLIGQRTGVMIGLSKDQLPSSDLCDKNKILMNLILDSIK